MNAKEYLQQVKALDVKIKQKIEEKEDLLRRARSISAIDYSKEKGRTISSSEAAFAKMTDRACDLEIEINREIDEFVNLKHAIINRIQQLADANEIAVLHKRYIEFLSFNEIAKQMNYSILKIHYLHSGGLKHLKFVQ